MGFKLKSSRLLLVSLSKIHCYCLEWWITNVEFWMFKLIHWLFGLFYFFPLMVKSNKKDQAWIISSWKLPRKEVRNASRSSYFLVFEHCYQSFLRCFTTTIWLGRLDIRDSLFVVQNSLLLFGMLNIECSNHSIDTLSYCLIDSLTPLLIGTLTNWLIDTLTPRLRLVSTIFGLTIFI